ncbi:L-histidine N(alpha)-methyltransferase [Thermoleptolyngbya sp. M55_K2018_002]|uniref:L-histidine N(alpha)-methyltransferase n=1 Tax=Thermoleptolyngbya sp. M55_K2018_002 TaxID=2747808 RepID=UPI0019ECA1E8|nr:L-histidine N(alpha)-methyltransferase [Thermoleptolyngbya sp. M55_K2018_002]HIK42654.1 L-histidine N(alpha)-methyltransferase [Thermoleptolyngbya sp. M55_K2018_002]
MTATLNSQLHYRPVKLYDFHPPLEDFQAAVLDGLQRSPKSISPQFLYDKRGSELFDAICTLPEYYLTRTEVQLLQDHATEIATYLGNGALVEFGSGSSQKVRILLDAAPQVQTYVGLDISRQHLYEACTALAQDYPGLEAIALCTDYTQSLPIDQIPELQNRSTIGFFPGSSIGNLEPPKAVEFLQNAAVLGDLIIGVDLKKSTSILEPAYDDAQGVSAAFALNLLTRINRELGADFDLSQFTYRARYDETFGRIEMQIVSLTEQTIRLGEVQIRFAEGETLRTEYSYKYTPDEFQMLAMTAGLQPIQVWMDAQQQFSIHYLKRL